MAKFANHFQYLTKIRQLLIGSGTQGISQHDLHQKTRTKLFQREHLMDALMEWELRDWVQQFKVKGISKHPKIMWRATTRLRDDWARYHLGEKPPTIGGLELGQQGNLFPDVESRRTSDREE